MRVSLLLVRTNSIKLDTNFSVCREAYITYSILSMCPLLIRTHYCGWRVNAAPCRHDVIAEFIYLWFVRVSWSGGVHLDVSEPRRYQNRSVFRQKRQHKGSRASVQFN